MAPELFVPLHGALAQAAEEQPVHSEVLSATPIIFKVPVGFSLCSPVDIGSRVFYSLLIWP